MKNKNSLVKFLVIFGFICAAAVAVAAVISRMQRKLSCAADNDNVDDEEGCTGNCCDCDFCDTDDVDDPDSEEKEETEISSETDKVEEK